MNIPEELLKNIDNLVNLVKQNGLGFLDQLRPVYTNNAAYSFIYPESPYYPIFKERLDAKLHGNPHNNFQASPQTDFKPNTGGTRPGSRWNVPSYSGTNEGLPYNPHQHGQPNPPPQQYKYNTMQQGNYSGTSPTNNMNNLNQGYPMYNANQGQYYNNPGNMGQMGNFQNIQQQGYPNYQGITQPGSHMMYRNSDLSPSLPSYMHPSHQQYTKTNERKSSVDKRDMEIESPRGGKMQKQYNNPEEVPVGVMADMLKQQAKKVIFCFMRYLAMKYKERNMSLKPYTPLDPEATPQVIPSVTKVSESVKAKIDLFYKYLTDERELDQMSKKKKSVDIDLEIYKSKTQSEKKGKDFIEKRSAYPDYQELITSEMGVRADGRSITSVPGGGEERRGLGGRSEDVYSQFRKQKSQNYHISAEERAVNRDLPDLCYVCRKPGHLARDCKFGLT